MKKGSHHTTEARSRMSLAHKDKSLSQEHKSAIGVGLKGNKNTLGFHHSEETKAKISATNKGRPGYWQGRHFSAETKAKISATLKGRPFSEEHKAKISAALKGKVGNWKGRHHTSQAKAKVSKAMKGNKRGLGHHLSEEAKAKIGAANRVNSTGKHPSEETRAKKSIMMKGEKNPFYGKHHSEETLRRIMLANQIKPNKQELKLQSILDEHFPNEWKFVGDGQLIIGGLCPDFANVNHKKAVIELYGDWWHQKTERWNYTELGRIMAFNSLGFKCLVIWEHELKNEGNVTSKVKQFMKREKR